jgi:pimeloyl-ACP methyl ester carboxylesterase
MKRIWMIFLAVLPSCGWLPRPTPIPVGQLSAGSRNGSDLVVFLPGRWSRVAEFERERFFEIAAKRWPNARLVAPDLHLGYYKNQSVARRLHEDVILPARRSGVKTVRLVGISMGGLGALIYDVEYPQQVNEMILLSPFVGEEDALKEIESAGGLEKWRPGEIAQRDFTRKLWLKLRESWREKGNRPRVLLGCGQDDRLAASNRLFAKEFLKPGEQLWSPGGHDWPTWQVLFERLIEK